MHQAIVSIDFVKQSDILDGIAVADMWDLIVVDESHKMSACRRGPTRIDRSQRHHLGEILSERAERSLLMTATPHKGDTENFRLLLALIDSDLFANEQILQRAVARQENPIFLRRLKEDMRDFKGQPLFPTRNAVTVRYKLEGDEYELYVRVTGYVENYFNRAMSADNRNVTFALIALQRRLASSVRSVRRSLGNRHQRLMDLRADVSRDPAELRRLRRNRFQIADDDDMTEEQRWELEQEALRFTVAENMDELDREIEHLEELIELAGQVENNQPERKLEELKGVINRLDIEHPGEKLLIFTEAKDTLDYLVEKFDEWRVPPLLFTVAWNPRIGSRLRASSAATRYGSWLPQKQPFDDARRLAQALGAEIDDLIGRYGIVKQRGATVTAPDFSGRADDEQLGVPARAGSAAPKDTNLFATVMNRRPLPVLAL